MSWHFSRALVAAYLQEKSSDGAQFAPLKSTPFAPDDSCSDRMRGICHRSPFVTMYVPSTDAHGKVLLTWYREVSPVPIYRRPVRKRALTASSVDSGWKWPESLAKYDPVSRGWKTRQPSLAEAWGESLVTWPTWGLMRAGECSALDISFPLMSANEHGSWPTPCHGSPRWGGTFQEVGGSQNKLRNTPTGRLYVNPDFWESLMGFPIGWTGIAPLATARIHAWRQQLSKSSQEPDI